MSSNNQIILYSKSLHNYFFFSFSFLICLRCFQSLNTFVFSNDFFFKLFHSQQCPSHVPTMSMYVPNENSSPCYIDIATSTQHKSIHFFIIVSLQHYIRFTNLASYNNIYTKFIVIQCFNVPSFTVIYCRTFVSFWPKQDSFSSVEASISSRWYLLSEKLFPLAFRNPHIRYQVLN